MKCWCGKNFMRDYSYGPLKVQNLPAIHTGQVRTQERNFYLSLATLILWNASHQQTDR